jgi:hypothetical protein
MQYIFETSGHITPGQISTLIWLNDIPTTLFPLLTTICVTSMSGMFNPLSLVLTQSAILTPCFPPVSVAYFNYYSPGRQVARYPR